MNVDTFGESFLDLSKTTKLKDLMFRWGGASVRWITMALQTVRSEKLQRITIQLRTLTLRKMVNGTDHQEWQDLDHLLVRFWTTHSIRPQVMYDPDEGGQDLKDEIDHMLGLLPELTRRGLVDVVETPPALRTTLTVATGMDIFFPL